MSLSRRTLVTTAAALPALAVPAVAAAIEQQNHPDAKLIALGEQYERLLPTFWERTDDFNSACNAAHALAYERIGVDPSAKLTSEQREVWCEELKASEREMGVAAATDRYDVVARQHDAMVDKIIATPAHTVKGLRAKALAAMQWNDNLWDDDDLRSRTLRDLIEAVFAVTDV